MFKAFNYYRHKNCLDTDILVLKVQYVGPSYTKLKVNFVDRVHTGYFELGKVIKVTKNQYKNWFQV